MSQQAAKLAAGREVIDPLPAVQAYADFDRFGVLPYGGGTFDQPDELLDEMRDVAAVVAAARRDRAEKEANREASALRRMFRRRG